MSLRGLWTRLARGERRLWQRDDWPAVAGADVADRVMGVRVTDRFHAKQGRSTGRWILEGAGRRLTVYLKRHDRLPWWRRLLAWLWPTGGWSPAWAEWRHLRWAQARGVPVPAPVAVGEFIGPGLALRSFLAVEELTGLLPLHEAIPHARAALPPAAFARWKRSLGREAARLVRLLHGACRFHKDLYLCHFFVAPAEAGRPTVGPGDVFVIDLHRLGHHPILGWYWRVKDLAQLSFSTVGVPGVTARDRLRFFRAYADGRGAGRWLRRAVLWKARRYERHNRRAADPAGGRDDTGPRRAEAA